MPNPHLDEAINLMTQFAERTGLTSHHPPRRYLWTDAFAVCNFLGLARLTGDQVYTDLARQLVDQVHHTLGRHRDDDIRTGWISGLDEQTGEQHPTRGGLRIGKALPERGPNDPYDEQLEWDRDGQYFHYLTKWMHALDQLARSTRLSQFNIWARELAKTACHAFVYDSASNTQPRRMVWKMNIALTHAQVAAMGQHDPLDGYITSLQLRATAAVLLTSDAGPDLEDETHQFAEMLKNGDWTTTDPLGLGGLLSDAYRLQQLRQQGLTLDQTLIDTLLQAALKGLHYYPRSGELQQPASFRLAFRELGLVIGQHAIERIPESSHPDLLSALKQYLFLRDEIVAFWREPAHQQSSTWREHQDINDVMLATALIPDGYLELVE